MTEPTTTAREPQPAPSEVTLAEAHEVALRELGRLAVECQLLAGALHRAQAHIAALCTAGAERAQPTEPGSAS